MLTAHDHVGHDLQVQIPVAGVLEHQNGLNGALGRADAQIPDGALPRARVRLIWGQAQTPSIRSRELLSITSGS